MNIEDYDNIIKECRTIAITKNRIYGDKNLLRFGLLGIYIRMQDKLERIENILFTDKDNLFRYNEGIDLKEIDETIEDTYKDLLNYINYSIQILRKQLGAVKKDEEN